MTQSQFVDQIREMPIAEQLALAETILKGLGLTAKASTRDLIRRQMAESANDAIEYYRTDPDVALWSMLDDHRLATVIREVSVDDSHRL